MSQIDAAAFEQPLEKHRLEIEDYSVDFAGRLSTGETLSSVSAVRVLHGSPGSWINVSSQFGITNIGTSGDKVLFRMGAATTGNQDANSDYYVRVQVSTSAGRSLTSVHVLYVSEQADTSAP